MDDVFRWIEGFINFERGQVSKAFRLDRTEALVRRCGNPERAFPTVHVAGSKGKGSTTTMIASIMDAAGIRTGLYVSPHVVDYRERVGLAGGPFPEDIYAQAGQELKAAVEAAAADGTIEEPTFFELMTTLFFLCCRRAGCGAAAVETGMGGRLDSTNVVVPRISVLTPIELEHTEYLGSTIELIAAEKAGIIKPGVPAAAAPQKDEALQVFRRACAARGSPLRYLPEEVSATGIRVDRNGTLARLEFADRTLFPEPIELRLRLVGDIQVQNAALAALAVRLSFPDIPASAVVSGLERTTLPARFELVSADPPAVVDGAHTAASVRIAADTFAELYGEGGVLLFACAADKDAGAMARILAPRFSRILVTKPGDFKKSDPEAAFGAFQALGAPVELLPETSSAVRKAFSLASDLKVPLLVTGSFYLAAIARRVESDIA